MALSRVLYRGLAALRAPRLAQRIRPGAPVFCFHNVVPEPEVGLGDASLHMPLAAFEDAVGWIAASYDVVPLAELADRASSGRSVHGLAAITFDDAYTGVFEHALPVLAAEDLPSMISVVSGFAQHPAYTWWDTLGARGLLSDKRRNAALSMCRGLAPEVLAAADTVLPDGALPRAYLPASWDRIAAAAGDGRDGVDLGSHTVRHPNLPTLTDTELDEEMSRSLQEIGDRTGRRPEVMAYPYGMWDPRVVRAASRAGYRIGLTLDVRAFAGGDDLLAIPRINVPAGISLDALACWAAGIRLRRPW